MACSVWCELTCGDTPNFLDELVLFDGLESFWLLSLGNALTMSSRMSGMQAHQIATLTSITDQ